MISSVFHHKRDLSLLTILSYQLLDTFQSAIFQVIIDTPCAMAYLTTFAHALLGHGI